MPWQFYDKNGAVKQLVSSPGTSVFSNVQVLETGISGQRRAGRVLTAADFTTLLGLTTPVGLFNLTDLTNLGSGGALVNKGAVTFGKGITGATTEAAIFTGSTAQALYIADTGAADPFRISYGSVGCWFKTAKKATIQALVTKWDGGSGQSAWALELDSNNDTLAAYVSTNGGGSYFNLSGTSSCADDRWHHAVMTHDGTTLSLYVDGVLEASKIAATPIFGGSAPLNIGGFNASSGVAASLPHFGRVDEAFVTPDVLTAEQVRLLYAYKFAHGATFTPTGVSLMVTRRRKGGSLAVGNFPSQPRRLYNFTAGALTDAGLDNAALTNNGTALAAPGVDGALGNAFNFNGTSQYLSATDTGLPSGTAARTLGCWLKTTQTGNAYIVQYGTAAGSAECFIFMGANGAISVGVGSTSVTSSAFYNDGQWHFACFTFDNAAADGLLHKLYVDGKLVGSATAAATATVLGGANAFRIGVRNSGVSFFGGQATKAFVQDTALTADDIANLYAVGSLSIGLSPKNEGDHIDRVDATNIYMIGDTLESQHLLDLVVRS